MELADRKSLYGILSFLDEKLPLYSSIHSLVNAVLLKPTAPKYRYRIYFKRNRKRSASLRDGENYTAIIGAKLNVLTESICKNAKVWRITGWAIDDKCFSEAIATVKEINWNEDYVVVAGKEYKPDSYTHEFLFSKRGVDLERLLCKSLDQFYIPIEQALSLRLSIPNDVFVKSLEQFHAQIVYDHWAARTTTSVEIIAEEINSLPSAGVFLKATNELVCWITYYPTNGMSRLHTLDQHRRKGYASLVIRYLSKRVAQAGFVPTANVGLGNEASFRVFESIGFQILQPWHIYFLSHFVDE